jgi:hypothetical protein
MRRSQAETVPAQRVPECEILDGARPGDDSPAKVVLEGSRI